MLRVAAYCRVSTDKSDQVHSFNSQKAYFSDYINNRSDWILAEIYADEGITGTTTSDRTGFLKMIDDAALGKFEIIITKEVSRFSRNLLDAISYTRKLKQLGIGVIFLNDGISTLETDAELRLGIMASVAQEESRKTSERVRWGQMRKMEHGVVFGRSLLGFDVKNGKISVEPEGAETVRQIFRMYLDDRMGVRAIAKVLTANKAATKTGGDAWSGATLLKIIKNEKYCGDLIQRKTVTKDYLTHKKTKNTGDDLIYICNHHEAIIARTDWEAAQAELRRRSSSKTKKESNGNRYALSGKVVCADCSAVFLCRTRKRKDGSAYRVWTCDRCTCLRKHRQVREDELIHCVRYLIAAYDKDRLIEGLDVIVPRVMQHQNYNETACEKEIILIERKKIKLIDAFLSGDVSREEYTSLKAQYEIDLVKIAEKIEHLKALAADGRLTDIMQVIALLASGEDADDEFYLSFVERIDIIDDVTVEIWLKNTSGKWKIVYRN